MASEVMTSDTTLAALIRAVGAEALVTDAAECDFYAQDVFTKGPAPVAVFHPADTAMLMRGMAEAARLGLAIVPRGGGMSYTSGYVADAAGALIVDTGRMDRIIAVNEADMTVTVEAGCTWIALYTELRPRGLRTPLWGTLSGIKATVGGGMSQNGVFWGGGTGTIAASALAMDVVLADGSLIRTGPGFLRPYGPDVTGLFAADAGAFGVKATITLPLVYDGTAFAYGSYAFDEAGPIIAAMSQVGREGLASECFGFDPFLQEQRMKRESLAKDAKQLLGMMRNQGSLWKGLKEGAKVVSAGRSFLNDARFSFHVICEGRHQGAVDADLARITAIALEHGGRVAENTIPKIMRANPFPPVNSMVGPEGERWVPVHGLVAHSKARAAMEAIEALFATHRAEMDRLEIGAGYMMLPVGHTVFLIEPVFFWPDQLEELHRRSIEPQHLARLRQFAANPAARALVETLRKGVVDCFAQLDGAHFQIGRTYPLLGGSDPKAIAILRALKHEVDPDGRMNPGALGLGT